MKGNNKDGSGSSRTYWRPGLQEEIILSSLLMVETNSKPAVKGEAWFQETQPWLRTANRAGRVWS